DGDARCRRRRPVAPLAGWVAPPALRIPVPGLVPELRPQPVGEGTQPGGPHGSQVPGPVEPVDGAVLVAVDGAAERLIGPEARPRMPPIHRDRHRTGGAPGAAPRAEPDGPESHRDAHHRRAPPPHSGPMLSVMPL